MRYDGAGRRIVYAVQNSGDLDVTYHAYYDGQSEVESRNGSDQVLLQYVWGSSGGAGQYIDELCQIALNQDPWNAHTGTVTENLCERFFYAMHDANYNVIGVTTHGGRLIERYEYTPYGQRQVFSHGWLMADVDGDGMVGQSDQSLLLAHYGSSGTDAQIVDFTGDGLRALDDLTFLNNHWGQSLPLNDPLVTHPRGGSFRGDMTLTSGVALGPVGHQGLLHDEELAATGGGGGSSGGTSLICNRARHLHPTLGRFIQRDPLGYVDGMSVYAYSSGSPVSKRDPSGLQTLDEWLRRPRELPWEWELRGAQNGVCAWLEAKIREYLNTPEEKQAWDHFTGGTGAEWRLDRPAVERILLGSTDFTNKIASMTKTCEKDVDWPKKRSDSVGITAPSPWNLAIGNTTVSIEAECAGCCMFWRASFRDPYDFDPKGWSTHRSAAGEWKTLLVYAAQHAGQCGWKKFDIVGSMSERDGQCEGID